MSALSSLPNGWFISVGAFISNIEKEVFPDILTHEFCHLHMDFSTCKFREHMRKKWEICWIFLTSGIQPSWATIFHTAIEKRYDMTPPLSANAVETQPFSNGSKDSSCKPLTPNSPLYSILWLPWWLLEKCKRLPLSCHASEDNSWAHTCTLVDTCLTAAIRSATTVQHAGYSFLLSQLCLRKMTCMPYIQHGGF